MNDSKQLIHLEKTAQLVLGFFLIGMFIFVISPTLTDHLLKREFEQIRNQELDCTPLFYTESEEAMEAIYHLSKNRKLR